MDFPHLFDILPYRAHRFPKALIHSTVKGTSWVAADMVRERDHLSAGLLSHGLHKGDRVALLAHCCSPEWVIADAALLQLGLITVPIHATARPDEVAHIVQHAQIKAAFVSNEALRDKLCAAGLTNAQLFGLGEIPDTVTWSELACVPDSNLLEKIAYYRDGLTPNDLATILYTSGTTGTPKGVMLTHSNIVSNVKSVLTIVPIDSKTVVVSFLPISHIFERMVLYAYQAAGATIHFSESIEQLPALLRTARPHFFTAVPRILERTYERLMEQRKSANPLVRWVVDWAIALGERFPSAGLRSMPSTYHVQRWIANLLVYRRWRRAMGGRLRYIAVGAAALQPRIGRLFSAAGIAVREGYGLTETSPVISFNRFEPGGLHFGTVGIPAPGVEVRIAPPTEEGMDGEIQVRGPNVMQGYWEMPDETAARFTPDGWLQTGDLGRFEYKRFLKITGRASEVFKTSTGKFVVPSFVEQQLLKSPFIAQCLVTGFNRPFSAALIVPNFDYLETWCRENKVHWTDDAYMVHNPKVLKLYQAEVARLNEQFLAPHERVRQFQLLTESWTIDNGLLTPTLKVRRKTVEAKYASDLEKLFAKKTADEV